MTNKIKKKATKVMCVVLAAATLFSNYNMTAVSATELPEQEAVSERLESEKQTEEQTTASELQVETEDEDSREEAAQPEASSDMEVVREENSDEEVTTAVLTEISDESSVVEESSIQEMQTSETDTEAITEEETVALGNVDDADFEYDTGSGTIIKYTGSASELVIPDRINGIPVTGIGRAAFEKNETLVSIVMPDTVTAIGEYVFKDCINLSEVKLPKSLKTMGTKAFAGCSSLKKIEIPASLEDAGYWNGGVFYGAGLKEVSFGSGAVRVADHLFLDCVALEEIDLPDTIIVIEESAFENCSNLSRVTIPRSVEVIQRKAFSGCDRLREITLPVSVVQIADNAFSDPQTLTIYGVTGSYAEEYAAKIGARFVGRSIQAMQVTITPAELCIVQGAQEILSIHVVPSDFTDNVTWKSSDDTIVSVDEKGVVTAKKIGKATVTVTAGTVSAFCEVSVLSPVKNLVLNKTSVHIATAQTVQLAVTVIPADAANQQIGWSSSDETIASVDENGLVTAAAEGSAVITATAQDGSGISAECTVTVVKSGTEINPVNVPIYKTVILNTYSGYADKTINAALSGLKDNVLEILEIEGMNKNAQKVQDDLEITAYGGNLKIGMKHNAGAIKKGTYRFRVKVTKKDGGQGTGILTIKITSAKPAVTYKSSGSINVLDREHTQVRFKPTIKNYTDSVKEATLSGIEEGLFCIDCDDDGYIIVKANKAALIALKPPYKPILRIELESGVTLEKRVNILVKQTNPGLEKTSVIPVTDGQAGAVTLKPKKDYAQIEKVELAKEDKMFGCVDEGNGRIKIYVKENPEKKPLPNKNYSLKLKVTFVDGAVNAKPMNVTVKVQYKK